MAGFGNNLSFNIFSVIKNLGKQGKEILSKHAEASGKEAAKELQQTKPGQTLVNTNSNMVINQPVLSNPVVNQSALNATNQPQTNLNQPIKNSTNIQLPPTPSQSGFQGPADMPAYAGITNMSLKSWIAEHGNKNFTQLESGEKQLLTTLSGIKGFQRQNYEGSGGDSQDSSSKDQKQIARKRYLLLLSHIFSSMEQSGNLQTELLVNISNFRKLGSLANKEKSSQDEDMDFQKLLPPAPDEIQVLDNPKRSNVKYLYQLLALPKEFPECLRLFAKDDIEINPKTLNTFLVNKLKFVQEQIFGDSALLNKTIAGFIPMLNHADYSLILPLILLYYPLPLPKVAEDYDFLNSWKKKDSEGDDKSEIIASCEVYYVSKVRGRFLLKFELNKSNEFSFSVQTAEENNGIVRDIESAIGESMFLLEHPPLLADLNVYLTKEIYKATDIDEELSIVSKGPMRLEIILAVYASLLILNKLADEADPAGLIEMIDLIE